jgi:hypothetical protein
MFYNSFLKSTIYLFSLHHLRRKLSVNAKIVVAAAGSIHTPALLLRSKLTNPMIGKNLTLHPVLGGGAISTKVSFLSMSRLFLIAKLLFVGGFNW